jgi:hypothetical protein
MSSQIRDKPVAPITPIIMPIKANLAVLVLSGLTAYADSTKENTVKETALRVIQPLAVARSNAKGSSGTWIVNLDCATQI